MRRSAKLILAIAAVLAATVTAWAYWSAPGEGSGSGSVGSLEPATISASAPATGPAVVSWEQQASVTGGSTSHITYTVERRLGSGGWEEITSGGCDGPLNYDTATCSDTSLTANGGYSYRVVAKFRTGWSATSNQAGPVDVTIAVADPAPTVASITRTGASPSDAASVGFTVTFSENVTGVDATDFATAATGVTGASVGTVSGSNTTYSVTVNTGSGSGTLGLDLVDDDSIVDSGANKLGGTGTGNGDFTGDLYTIDKPSVVSINRSSAENPTNDASVTWTVTFSEPVNGVNVGAGSDFALVQTGSVSGSALTTATAVGGAPATSWTVTATTGVVGTTGSLGLNLIDNDSITDPAGRRLGGVGTGNGNFTGEVFTIDKVAPTLQSLQMFDDNANGLVDRVDAVFSETLETAGADVTTGWAAASAPGGVTLSAVGVAGSTASLTFSGGTASTSSTVPGGFAVTLSAVTGQIRDAAGNKAGFTGQAVADKAGPVPLSFVDAGGNADGLFQTNDSLTVTFTEDLLASYSASGGAVLRGGSGTSNDEVALPGSDGAFASLGRNDYISGSGTMASFPAASAARAGTNSANRPLLRITLGNAACSGACASLTTAAGTGSYTYVPDPAIEDAAGNGAQGSRTQPIRLF